MPFLESLDDCLTYMTSLEYPFPRDPNSFVSSIDSHFTLTKAVAVLFADVVFSLRLPEIDTNHLQIFLGIECN